MITSRLCVVPLLAVFIPSSGPPPSAQEPGRAAAVEELLAEKDAGTPAHDEEDVASPDRRKVAWRAAINQKWSVMLNGVRQGGTFDEVRFLTFSLDGQHLAFAARRDKIWILVLDGIDSARSYHDVRRPVFSSQGGRLAYAAKPDKQWTIVQDGNEGSSTYSDVGFPRFSVDGKHILYRAKPGKKWILLVDGQSRGGEYDEIVAPSFGPDGQRVAYVGRRGSNYVAVLDGKEDAPFDIIGGLAFSADSRRFAYGGAKVEQGFGSQKATGRAMIDGAAGPVFEGKQIGSLLKSMATGTTVQLVAGHFRQLLSDTHGVTAPVFSPNSRRVAYAARRDKSTATVLVDGEAGATLPPIVAGPVFSPDSQHLAIVVSEAATKTLVVDGVKVGRGSEIETDFIAYLTFAPDSERVAYVGVNGGSWYELGGTVRAKRRVCVDGIAGSEYDAWRLPTPQFTPDSQHVMYVVVGVSESSRNVSFVVVDRIEGKRYDAVYESGPDPDGRSVSYIAQAGRKFYLVRQALAQTTAPE